MGCAAKRLAISQPVVSKTIANLQQTLGVRLFDRTSQGVGATVSGGALLNCGTAVFDDLRREYRRSHSCQIRRRKDCRLAAPGRS